MPRNNSKERRTERRKGAVKRMRSWAEAVRNHSTEEWAQKYNASAIEAEASRIEAKT